MTVRTQGRIAGLIYLGVVLTGLFALAYAPNRLFVEGDPAATATALAANQSLFHAANYASIAMCLFFLGLPFALARFLSPYGRNAARLMILLVAASIPFTLLAIAQHFELASLVGGAPPAPIAIEAKIAAYDRWLGIASIFWGLWLAPLGWLIMKSGAVPRVFGVLLILGCLGYLADYFGPIVSDGYRELPFRRLISLPGSVGEIGLCLWLLVMGARGPVQN